MLIKHRLFLFAMGEDMYGYNSRCYRLSLMWRPDYDGTPEGHCYFCDWEFSAMWQLPRFSTRLQRGLNPARETKPD